MREQIKIVPLGDVDHGLLEYLVLTLSGSFGTPCRAQQSVCDLPAAYSSTRRQFYSTQLLTTLKETDANGSKVLGVTDVDLFIPIFTFVFGEAQVGGRAALMSTHRLRQEFYGLPSNNELLYTRAEKEATHELGHAFGLPHCPSFDCVMHFSNSVEQVDLKTCEFCQLCQAKLDINSHSNLDLIS